MRTKTATKTCRRSGEARPATAEYFHRHKGQKDGLWPECKPCANKYQAEWRAKKAAAAQPAPTPILTASAVQRLALKRERDRAYQQRRRDAARAAVTA